MADMEFKEPGSYHRDISSYIDTGGSSDVVDAFDSLIDSDSETEATSTTRI